MPAKQHDKEPASREKQTRPQLDDIIGQHVIRALGQPGDLHRVQVRHLWENRYRVNVLVGTDAAHVKVAHSYFVVADCDGRIVESTPKITKQY